MFSGDWFYRLLLYLYPTEFRGAYGREMTQIFRDRTTHESVVRVWFDIGRDLILTVPLRAKRMPRKSSIATVWTSSLRSAHHPRKRPR